MFEVDIACICHSEAQRSFSNDLQEAGFNGNFISLAELESSLEQDQKRAKIDYCPPLLFLTSNDIAAADRLLSKASMVFDLLVCDSEKVLNAINVLSRCGTILIAPWEKDVLTEVLIESLFSKDELETGLSALSTNFVGQSEPVKNLIRVIDRVARYDAPVLVSGETGTGKELVARGIHYESKRCDYPFVPVNCGALTDELLISELFGHESGAFTDAKRQHVGLVQQASKGTLFLDEIDSLSLKAQSSLLRFLQDQEYRPLGGEKVLRSDVRIICATNRDLAKQVKLERFREDLFYRLKILDVHTPALKDRRSDIGLLLEHFLIEVARKYGEGKKRLHPLTERWMVQDYDWPGNVRELENYVHRIFVLSKGRTIYVPDIMGLPLSIKMIDGRKRQSNECQIGLFQEEKATHISRFEKSYLSNLMEHALGNVSEAARIAGKERRALGKLLKKHGIDYQNYRKETS